MDGSRATAGASIAAITGSFNFELKNTEREDREKGEEKA